MQKPPHPDLESARRRIGLKVRELRLARRWTQEELASRLHLSQNRLSEIERGGGSFAAEQLLAIFQLFQVGPADFVEPDDTRDPLIGSLLNALVKFGARHLVADDTVVIRSEHERPVDVVQQVLIRHPSARFITAVPPALIVSHGEVSFPAVQHALARAGVPSRWGWLLEHFLAALDSIGPGGASVRWRRDSRRARTLAEHFLQAVPRPSEDAPLDLLDPDLRSSASVTASEAGASAIDRRWRVLGRLGLLDFVGPLEVVRDTL